MQAVSFRIDGVSAESGLIVLLVSGKLTGEHVDTLRNALRQESGALAIDLKYVSLVDRDGVHLLALAEYNGTELKNCPKYVREWLNRESVSMRGEN